MPTDRPCPVCEHLAPRRFCERDGVRFVRCGACGSLYQASRPDPVRLDAIYQRDYHAARGHCDNAAVEAVKRATVRGYLRMLDRARPPGRRLLEVGCSTGLALETAAQEGWDVEGVEVSAQAAEIARQRPGIRCVHAGQLADADLPADHFDAIVLFDVIEHIDPPGPTLAALHHLLKPGGVLLMVTPDGASPSARLLGSRWPHLFIEHVILFSRRAMRCALTDTGFQVERLDFAWKRVNIEMLVLHATLHRHVAFGGILRAIGRILPMRLQRWIVPFNIGEFYVIARRCTTSETARTTSS